MKQQSLLISVAALCTVTSSVAAAFIPSDNYGWSRGSVNSTHFEWDIFQSPTGPNPPDVGMFPSPLPSGWTPPNVVETSGASFITGGGNIYSFSAPTDFDVNFPNYGRGAKWTTTVLVQVRTLGSELEYSSVRLGSLPALARVELDRQLLGGFGGVLVDTLFRFELTGNATNYLLEFNAAASSMSLDRLALDTQTRRQQRHVAPVPVTDPGCPDCVLGGSIEPRADVPNGLVPAPGAATLLIAGCVLAARRRR